MGCENLSEVLTSINVDDDLNESNIIEKIKEKLEKENLGTYQQWKDNRFDINYIFNDLFTLLHI
ncbi:MAG: hypothetical protein LBC06_01515 [Rickettsiales bacterium]|jgi:hypothetical protein|nr:hypothetical protein [Rickettsiales bacterium]